MEIVIKGETREIAALVVGLQERRAADDSFVDEIAEKLVSRFEETCKERGQTG